jgi:hypothetical protein
VVVCPGALSGVGGVGWGSGPGVTPGGSGVGIGVGREVAVGVGGGVRGGVGPGVGGGVGGVVTTIGCASSSGAGLSPSGTSAVNVAVQVPAGSSVLVW